jgi:hypothetical protein
VARPIPTLQTTRDAQHYARRDVRRGHVLGFAATVLAMAGAVYCASIGATTVAVVLLGVPVMAVARALIDSAKTPKAPVQLPTAPADLEKNPESGGPPPPRAP